MEKDEDGFYTAPAAASTTNSDTAKAPTPDTTPATPPEPSKEATDLIKSTFDVHVTLAQQQEDKSSPLYSVKSFEELGLHADLLKGIYDMGFTKPSKIQGSALPLLLRDP